MTTDLNGWRLTGQALDHHETTVALDSAVSGQLGEVLAGDLATELARSGYALVRITPVPDTDETFFSRKED